MLGNAAALRDRELPGLAHFVDQPGGLVSLEITTALAHATIFLHGAHLSAWQPVGHAPVLFLSSRSHFIEGKPIRGGVPVIFPWFGPRAGDARAPSHGFARTAEWTIETLDVLADQTISITLLMEDSDTTRAIWPHAFALRHRLAVGADLTMALEVENRSEAAFTFEEALHTYLTVSDVRHVAVNGLCGAAFIDKTQDFRRLRHDTDPLTLTAEMDRVFVNTPAPCVLEDPVLNRRIHIQKKGSASTVVWNPWASRALALNDLGPDEWTSMLCVESGNIGENAVLLSPGGRHTMEVRISLAKPGEDAS